GAFRHAPSFALGQSSPALRPPYRLRTRPSGGRDRSMADAAAPATYTLYEARKKIHPSSVKGKFRSIKWAILAVALAVYYLLPFLRWSRGPHEPSQAVLIDL